MEKGMRGFGHSLREPKPRPSGSMLVALASSSKTSYCMRFAHGGFSVEKVLY